jgi:hypothetical protein
MSYQYILAMYTRSENTDAVISNIRIHIIWLLLLGIRSRSVIAVITRYLHMQ